MYGVQLGVNGLLVHLRETKRGLLMSESTA